MITRGIIYICLATFAFAWMNIIAKYLSDFHPMQVVFFRSLGSFALIFPYMLVKKVPLVGKEPKWLILRAVVGLISLSTFFIAIQRIPLGSAISIRYIGPLFGSVLAIYFLKEKIAKKQWWSFLIAFIGVLVLKGVDLRIDLVSFLIVLASAFTLGGVYVLIRYLAIREHPLTIINYFMVTAVLISLFFISDWRMPVESEWPPVIAIGIFGTIGQVLMTKAFSLETTAILAPFKYMELVFALIMGFLFFGEGYDLLALFGMTLIIVGMLTNVYWKEKIVGT